MEEAKEVTFRLSILTFQGRQPGPPFSAAWPITSSALVDTNCVFLVFLQLYPMSTAVVVHERRRGKRQCARYPVPSVSETTKDLLSQLKGLDSTTIAVLGALGGTALTLGALKLGRRWKRIRNADGVPPRLLDNQNSIVGVVTR